MEKEDPQARWQRKAGLISKSYKLRQSIVDDFAKACKKAKISQAKQLSKMMLEFIKTTNQN